MPKYRVTVDISHKRTIEVDAEDADAAREIMWAQIPPDQIFDAIVSSRELYDRSNIE